jgi:hypothetical protein
MSQRRLQLDRVLDRIVRILAADPPDARLREVVI